MLSLCLLGTALAGTPVPETLPAVDKETGIQVVPSGSFILLQEETGWDAYKLPEKYWLLPDSHYTEAIKQAKKLAICQPALDAITEESLKMADRAYTAISKCDGQFDVDEGLIADLTGQVGTWETRALVAEAQLKQARKDKWVAWGITGGLVLGAATATTLTLAK